MGEACGQSLKLESSLSRQSSAKQTKEDAFIPSRKRVPLGSAASMQTLWGNAVLLMETQCIDPSFFKNLPPNFTDTVTFSEESLPSKKMLGEGIVWERQDKRAVSLPPSLKQKRVQCVCRVGNVCVCLGCRSASEGREEGNSSSPNLPRDARAN